MPRKKQSEASTPLPGLAPAPSFVKVSPEIEKRGIELVISTLLDAARSHNDYAGLRRKEMAALLLDLPSSVVVAEVGSAMCLQIAAGLSRGQIKLTQTDPNGAK